MCGGQKKLLIRAVPFRRRRRLVDGIVVDDRRGCGDGGSLNAWPRGLRRRSRCHDGTGLRELWWKLVTVGRQTRECGETASGHRSATVRVCAIGDGAVAFSGRAGGKRLRSAVQWRFVRMLVTLLIRLV